MGVGRVRSAWGKKGEGGGREKEGGEIMACDLGGKEGEGGEGKIGEIYWCVGLREKKGEEKKKRDVIGSR